MNAPSLRGDGPSTRRGKHLKNVRAALTNWRFYLKSEKYPLGPFIATVILPDPILTTLTSNAHLHIVDDIEVVLAKTLWTMAQQHRQEVLGLLKKPNDAEKAEQERAKEGQKVACKRETAAQHVKQQQQKEFECTQCQLCKNMTQKP